jgi:hypothetical protein
MRFGIPCMGDVNARTGPTGNGRILAQSRPKYAGLTLCTGDLMEETASAGGSDFACLKRALARQAPNCDMKSVDLAYN